MTTPRKRRTLAVAAGIAAVTVVLGVIAMPRPPALAPLSSGEEGFAGAIADHVRASGGTLDRVSVAVIDPDGDRRAHFGATDDTEYEIGSVTKTMTASLLAIAVDRGEVRMDTPLGDLLDLGDSAAAAITLEQLATHHSGLPRLASSPASMVHALLSQIRASDPYAMTRDDLVAAARGARVGDKTFVYSNFGYALLGHALAAAAGTEWHTLVADRIFAPLSMHNTSAPVSPDDLGPDPATGYTAGGRTSAPWTLGGDAPAGSVRSTTADIVTYLSAQLDETAPGSRAATPVTAADGDDTIGLGWFTRDTVVWHNGGTGGFSSFVAFDRDADRLVVVLANTANNAAVDALGGALARGEL